MNTYSLKANFSRFEWSNALVKLADVLLIVLLTLGLSRVEAADYYEIGIGQSKLHRNTGYGWWHQDGADQVYSEKNPAWSIRAGWNVNEWLDIEAGARDLGRQNFVGSFISDPGYQATTAGTCTFPCGENVVSVYGEGRVFGIDARAKVGKRFGSFRPFMTVGVFNYKATFRTYGIAHDNTGFIKQSYQEVETRIRPTYSIGAEYKDFFVEWQIDQSVGTEQSSVNGAQTITFGVKF